MNILNDFQGKQEIIFCRSLSLIVSRAIKTIATIGGLIPVRVKRSDIVS